jgi:hypothetical protein
MEGHIFSLLAVMLLLHHLILFRTVYQENLIVLAREENLHYFSCTKGVFKHQFFCFFPFWTNLFKNTKIGTIFG